MQHVQQRCVNSILLLKQKDAAGTQVAAFAALVSVDMLGSFFQTCSLLSAQDTKTWLTDLNGRKSDW
jgi:hypothetical protein